MKKILSCICTIMLLTVFTVGVSAEKTSKLSIIEQIMSKLPIEQQENLKSAIAAAKNDQTLEFLNSDQGKALTDYLTINPEIGSQIIKSTEAYQYLFENKPKKYQVEKNGNEETLKFSDGSYVSKSNEGLVEVAAGKIYHDNNSYDVDLWVGYAELDLDIDYEVINKKESIVNITDVEASATSTGVGVSADYNADKKIGNNGTPDAYAKASFTLSVEIAGVGSTTTPKLRTEFGSNATPLHKNKK